MYMNLWLTCETTLLKRRKICQVIQCKKGEFGLLKAKCIFNFVCIQFWITFSHWSVCLSVKFLLCVSISCLYFRISNFDHTCTNIFWIFIENFWFYNGAKFLVRGWLISETRSTMVPEFMDPKITTLCGSPLFWLLWEPCGHRQCHRDCGKSLFHCL